MIRIITLNHDQFTAMMIVTSFSNALKKAINELGEINNNHKNINTEQIIYFNTNNPLNLTPRNWASREITEFVNQSDARSISICLLETNLGTSNGVECPFDRKFFHNHKSVIFVFFDGTLEMDFSNLRKNHKDKSNLGWEDIVLPSNLAGRLNKSEWLQPKELITRVCQLITPPSQTRPQTKLSHSKNPIAKPFDDSEDDFFDEYDEYSEADANCTERGLPTQRRDDTNKANIGKTFVSRDFRRR